MVFYYRDHEVGILQVELEHEVSTSNDVSDRGHPFHLEMEVWQESVEVFQIDDWSAPTPFLGDSENGREEGILGDVLEFSDCPNLKERLNLRVYKGHLLG